MFRNLKLARKNIILDSLKFGTASCMVLFSIYLATVCPIYFAYNIGPKTEAARVIDSVGFFILCELYCVQGSAFYKNYNSLLNEFNNIREYLILGLKLIKNYMLNYLLNPWSLLRFLKN
jgi:hypothetical protein